MKDKRYKAVKSLIVTGEFSRFADIFDVIPVSVVAKDTGINYSTLHRKINNTQQLNLSDFETLANLFDVDMIDLIKLAIKSMIKQ